ncbi:hypothetical protein B0H19DRAFT_1366926 [Mycena capillaripes]|nr:hypothetical protein B0H19DRAFT_1366926 [Mycena capillaripes]
MNAHTPALTISSLPDELLEAIAAAGQEGRLPDFQGAFKSEWTLSHISRRFREVIVGTPALWTLIEATLEKKGSVEILKLYLARSGSHNICAALRLPSHADIYGVLVMEERLRLIVPHIHRIWRLSVMLKAQRRTPNSRFRIPSLKSLHLAISNGGSIDLPLVLDLFDTPAVTEIGIDGAHGKQICVLFNSPAFPHASFTALTTFSFSNNYCAHSTEVMMTFPPLWLFPALSSLSLIKQCFMRYLVDDLLGQPWPLLKTVTLYPMERDAEAVGNVLLVAIRAKRQRGEPLPKLRLSPSLFSAEAWRDAGADVEILDPVDSGGLTG